MRIQEPDNSLCSISWGEKSVNSWATESQRHYLETGLKHRKCLPPGVRASPFSSFRSSLGSKVQRSSRKDKINPTPHPPPAAQRHLKREITFTHLNLAWQQPLGHFSPSIAPPEKAPEAEKEAVRSTHHGCSPALAGPDWAGKHLLASAQPNLPKLQGVWAGVP